MFSNIIGYCIKWLPHLNREAQEGRLCRLAPAEQMRRWAFEGTNKERLTISFKFESKSWYINLDFLNTSKWCPWLLVHIWVDFCLLFSCTGSPLVCLSSELLFIYGGSPMILTHWNDIHSCYKQLHKPIIWHQVTIIWRILIPPPHYLHRKLKSNQIERMQNCTCLFTMD